MSATRRLEGSYKHLMRVRMGPSLAPGVLLLCETRSGDTYWKVRLDTGAWVAPVGLIVDGPGTTVAPCASCELPFLREAGSGELICPRCHAEQFGEASRVDDPPPRYRNHYGRRRRY
jgi:hypothetical protein